MKEFFILLPVHNRKEITLTFIRNLKQQTIASFKLILIDDGSSDGTSESVRKELQETIILQGNGSLWWAGSLQLGLEYLKLHAQNDSSVLIINDDTILPPNFIEIGLNYLIKNPNSLVCSNYKVKGKFITAGVKIDWTRMRFKSSPLDIDCVPTRGLFLRMSSFEKIGGFHPVLLPHYLSDYEFTIRAKRKGHKLLCPEDLYLEPMLEETGTRTVKNQRGLAYFKKLFSVKCPDNPIYLCSFSILAAPFKLKILSLTRVLIAFTWNSIKHIWH